MKQNVYVLPAMFLAKNTRLFAGITGKKKNLSMTFQRKNASHFCSTTVELIRRMALKTAWCIIVAWFSSGK
jgi:hypothetical protein